MVTNTLIAAALRDFKHTVLPVLNTAGKCTEPSNTGLSQERRISIEQMKERDFKLLKQHSIILFTKRQKNTLKHYLPEKLGVLQHLFSCVSRSADLTRAAAARHSGG